MGDTKSSCHIVACHSPGSLCISSSLFSLHLLPPPSEPWHLGWTVLAHGVACPLPPLWCGVSLVCFMSCQWSLRGPPLPLASQTSPASLQGPVCHLCFFLHWPTCSSLALRFLLFQWDWVRSPLGVVLFDPWGTFLSL